VNQRATGRQRLHRHRVVALTAAIVLSGAVLVGTAGAQTPERAPSAAKPTRGGSVTYGLEAETNGGWCIPQAQLVISGIMVASAIYDTLTVPNSTGKIVPYLAKSVTHDPTYTKWTITLRDGVQFHDGTPLTADAVKQNIDAWRKGRLLGFVFTNIADTTVVDPLTVQVTTKVPWVDFDSFLYLAGRAGIAAPAQLANPETCPTNLIGTGPFMIYNGAGHWIQNQEFVATRNPHYWQKDRFGTQLPYLDKITFKPNPDAEQRLNQLQAGQLDMMHTTSGQVMSQLDGISSLNQMREKAGRREVRYYLLNAAKPPFDDLDARKAVAYALDTNQINVIRNDSQLQVADQPFDTKVPGHLAKPGYPKHDLAKAKQMVKAYKDAHAGQFNVVIESTNDPENSGEAQLIKRQFAQAGINATLQQEDQASFVNTALGGNFSLLLWRNHPGEDPDTQYVWWTEASPINFGKFKDPQLQTLLDQGRSEPDPEKRTGIYEQVNKIFATQVYNLWAYWEQWDIASNPKVQGLMGPPLPDGGGTAEFVFGKHPVVGLWVKK
jgi:peptide/nickel transport system substrate-binding protein